MDRLIKEYGEYLKAERGYSPHTLRAYMKDLETFEEFLTGRDILKTPSIESEPTPGTQHTDNHKSSVEGIRWETVETNDIRGWLNDEARRGAKSSTIRRKAQSVRSLFRYLQQRELVKRNPATGITLAKKAKPLPSVVREEEMECVLDIGDVDDTDFISLRNHLIINMLYSCGLRSAELIGLNDTDIDTVRGELRVFGKRSKERILPLPPPLLEEITKYQHARDAAFPDSEETGHPLIIHKGRRIRPGVMALIVKHGLSGTSSAKRSPHVLRHSFATAMLNNGADLNSVKEMLGHTSLATTQIYTHLTFNELRTNYDRAHPRSMKKDKDKSKK